MRTPNSLDEAAGQDLMDAKLKALGEYSNVLNLKRGREGQVYFVSVSLILRVYVCVCVRFLKTNTT